jgi:small subunit ribosomal protein S18
MSKSKPRPPKAKESTKKIKKKTSVLVQERVDYVDYKDVNLLQRFMSDRSKIRSRRVSGNNVQQQRDVATAIKNAREMALMPYTKRVTTQRSSRPDRERGERPDRAPAAEARTAEAEAEVDVTEVVDVDEVAETGEE